MKTVLKWAGVAVGSLVGLILLAAAGIYVYGGHLDARTLSTAPDAKPLLIASNPAILARGEHLATAIGKCADCHTADFGGGKFIDDPKLGSISAPNITGGKGSRLASYDDAALERLLRHGIKIDGHPALVMPSEVFNNFSDEDMAALIAYIRSLPKVDREPGPKNLKFLARALVTFGIIKYGYDQIDQSKSHVSSVVAGVTADYGKYMVDVGGCRGCHGNTLSGGPIPGGPPGFKPAANITPKGIGHYKEQDFFRALREGIRPGNVPIDTIMPYKFTKLMTDDEIKAVYAYLKTVPAKDYGGH
jgi:cytochrome c553